jgi:hypothetical protein
MTRRRLFACFNPRLLLQVAVALAVLLAAAFAMVRTPRGAPLRLVFAGVEALAYAWIILPTVRSIRRLDELEQRMHLEAIAAAFAFTAVIVTASGFFHHAGLPAVEWSAWIWPCMAVLWGVALAVVARRYR